MLRTKISNFKINDGADYLLLQNKKKTFTRILFIYLKIDDKKKEKIKKMWNQYSIWSKMLKAKKFKNENILTEIWNYPGFKWNSGDLTMLMKHWNEEENKTNKKW